MYTSLLIRTHFSDSEPISL